MSVRVPEDRWDRLDEAMVLLDEGDVEGAERLVRAFMSDHPDDFAGEAALDVVEDVRAGRPVMSYSGEADADAEAAEVHRQAHPFRCLTCGNQDHDVRIALLNTRWVSLFGFAELNREATCQVCKECGHVHWFVTGMPGVFQELHPRLRQAREERQDDGERGCMVCGFEEAQFRSVLLNTRWVTFFGFDWLNARISTLSCRRCGHVHWHLGDGSDWHLPLLSRVPPDPPIRRVPEGVEGPRMRCLDCGSDRLRGREGLLNSRALTRFDLDWMDVGALVVECEVCHFATWYLGPSAEQ